MYQRNRAQKISIAVAIISFILAVVCLVAMLVYASDHGMENGISASLMASIVFFCGVGVVLYVIGSTNLPNLKIGKEAPKQRKVDL